MPCTAFTRSGAPCAFPEMGTSGYCFNHDPKGARRRAAVRSRGGKAKAASRAAAEVEAKAPEAAAPPPPTSFDLGPMSTLEQIALAHERVARAVAAGQLDPKRARLLRELLREAHDRRADSPVGASDGRGREPTNDELEYIVANGRPPAFVQIVTPRIRVEGPVWFKPEPPSAETDEPTPV